MKNHLSLARQNNTFHIICFGFAIENIFGWKVRGITNETRLYSLGAESGEYHESESNTKCNLCHFFLFIWDRSSPVRARNHYWLPGRFQVFPATNNLASWLLNFCLLQGAVEDCSALSWLLICILRIVVIKLPQKVRLISPKQHQTARCFWSTVSNLLFRSRSKSANRFSVIYFDEADSK